MNYSKYRIQVLSHEDVDYCCMHVLSYINMCKISRYVRCKCTQLLLHLHTKL